MSWEQQIILRCDYKGCKHIFTAQGAADEYDARETSQRNGWAVGERGWQEFDYCPTHAKGTHEGQAVSG